MIYYKMNDLLPRVGKGQREGCDFAPNRSKFFSFRVDPFSEWSKIHFGRVVFLESLQTPRKEANLYFVGLENGAMR